MPIFVGFDVEMLSAVNTGKRFLSRMGPHVVVDISPLVLAERAIPTVKHGVDPICLWVQSSNFPEVIISYTP